VGENGLIMQCALLSKASTAPAVYAKLPMFLNFKIFIFLGNFKTLKKSWKFEETTILQNKSSGHLIRIFTAQF